MGVPLPEEAWRFEGDCIHLANPSRRGSLYSAQPYDSFELEFEWKISRAGNSGVKYMCVPGLAGSELYLWMRTAGIFYLASPLVVLVGLLGALRMRWRILDRAWGRRAGFGLALLLVLWVAFVSLNLARAFRMVAKFPAGLEYQITDDLENTNARLKPTHRTAALYDLFPPAFPVALAVGEFHRSRILVQGDLVEHWLDGQKVLTFRIGSPELKKAIAGSKFAGVPAMAGKHAGLLQLQNHESEVWFRSVRIRHLL